MTTRGRTLVVGGALLAVVAAGVLAGFLVIGGNEGSPATTGTTPTTSPSGTPSDVRAQVEQAYLHAWDVWADALLRLDPSRLLEAFTGRALQLVTAQVEEQSRKDHPVRIRAEHNYKITIIDATTTSVDDRYINHNVRLDPDTLEPIEKEPSRLEHRSFTMKLVNGTWKIERIIEYR
jgi:hypothetical protein